MVRPCLALLIVILAVAPSSALAQEAAGTITRLKGEAMAGVADLRRPLAVGSPIYVGDRITTGTRTRVEMTMADGSVITLGDGSEFTIGDFEAEERGRVFGLLRGVFLAVSGTLSSGSTSLLTIGTPFGTIGVRGTTLWGTQSAEKLEVVLIDGRIFVESRGRRIELTTPRTATTVLPGAAPTPPAPVSEEELEAARRTIAFE